MTERGDAGWFAGLDGDDATGDADAIATGSAASPRDWPRLAVETGVVDSEAAYYERLHRATITAAREAARERGRAGDRQVIHAVRAMDAAADTANELAERVAEWAGDYLDVDGDGVAFAREIAGRDPTDPVEERVVGLARLAVATADERDDLEAFLERELPGIAPNLTALAGPVLAARLVALAGGLEPLAKKPAGTVQVLGAEDALFAHLRGEATSPKHGVIYAHEYVRGTRPEDRGSAARAVAGKLAIAARVDHYAGDRRPELETALDDRIQRIRERGSP